MHGNDVGRTPELTEWASLSLPADLALVGPTVAKLLGWLAVRGIGEADTRSDTGLAVTEALTNAIRHKGNPGDVVRLAWRWREEQLEIEISEPGRFAPPATWSQLPDDPLAEGGRGGFLITRLMDAVEHRNEHGRHALCLRKRLTCLPPADPAETEATLEAMTEELGNTYETVSALFHFARSLATAADLRTLGEQTFEKLRPLAEASTVWVRLVQADGGLALLAQAGGAPGPALIAADADVCEAAVARLFTEQTLARRCDLPAGDPLHARAGCAFVCPFSYEGNFRGLLGVTRDDDARGFFSAGQLGLVRTLADFMGIACGSADLQLQRQQAERAARELEIAEQIQQALLPAHIAPHPAWLVQGVCAQAAEVGGDFYDVFDLASGSRLVVIADVMGKGVPAALLATTLRTAIRAHAASVGDPGRLLTLVNRQLCADLQHLEMFITAQVLWLEPTGTALTYANAGHCPLLVLGGEKLWQDEGGLPLGVRDEETYTANQLEVGGAARIVLMTDGFLERQDAAGRELGLDGAVELVRTTLGPAVPDAGAALIQALGRRSPKHTVRDDCTLVVLTPLNPGSS